MSIDTIQSEYVFSLRKKRIYKKRPTSKSNLKSVCKFKNIRTEFILFDYIFGYNSFLSFCNLMVFMQNNAVCNSWYECKNKYNRNKSFDVFACPYFLDNIGNPRSRLLLTGKTVFISLIYSLQTLLFIALVLF